MQQRPQALLGILTHTLCVGGVQGSESVQQLVSAADLSSSVYGFVCVISNEQCYAAAVSPKGKAVCDAKSKLNFITQQLCLTVVMRSFIGLAAGLITQLLSAKAFITSHFSFDCITEEFCTSVKLSMYVIWRSTSRKDLFVHFWSVVLWSDLYNRSGPQVNFVCT